MMIKEFKLWIKISPQQICDLSCPQNSSSEDAIRDCGGVGNVRSISHHLHSLDKSRIQKTEFHWTSIPDLALHFYCLSQQLSFLSSKNQVPVRINGSNHGSNDNTQCQVLEHQLQQEHHFHQAINEISLSSLHAKPRKRPNHLKTSR